MDTGSSLLHHQSVLMFSFNTHRSKRPHRGTIPANVYSRIVSDMQCISRGTTHLKRHDLLHTIFKIKTRAPRTCIAIRTRNTQHSSLLHTKHYIARRFPWGSDAEPGAVTSREMHVDHPLRYTFPPNSKPKHHQNQLNKNLLTPRDVAYVRALTYTNRHQLPRQRKEGTSGLFRVERTLDAQGNMTYVRCDYPRKTHLLFPSSYATTAGKLLNKEYNVCF